MESEKESEVSENSLNWKFLVGGILLVVLLIGGVSVFQSQRENSSRTLKEGEDQINVELNLFRPSRNERKNLNIGKNTTAFTALNSTYRVDFSSYSQGVFIESIDGTKQNSTHSWLYFVNGQPPTESVDSYVLKEEDNLTFMYLGQEESKKYFE